jgi:hypothetical protein
MPKAHPVQRPSGWEKDRRAEAEALAAYLIISMAQMASGVHSLRNQGVLMPQGRYLYVKNEEERAAMRWKSIRAKCHPAIFRVTSVRSPETAHPSIWPNGFSDSWRRFLV